jgi:hypothetical protein
MFRTVDRQEPSRCCVSDLIIPIAYCAREAISIAQIIATLIYFNATIFFGDGELFEKPQDSLFSFAISLEKFISKN